MAHLMNLPWLMAYLDVHGSDMIIKQVINGKEARV